MTGPTIQLALGLDIDAVALYGTRFRTLSSGAASFADLVVEKDGTYELVALAVDYGVSISSTPFVVAPALVLLQFTISPSNSFPLQPFSARVSAYDTTGTLLTTYTSVVTLSLVGATLSGTLTTNAAGGVANFAGLSIATMGKYTLKASDGSALTFSEQFTIEPQLTFPSLSNVQAGVTSSVLSYLQLFTGSKSTTAQTITLSQVSGPGTLTIVSASISVLNASNDYVHQAYVSAAGTYVWQVLCSTCPGTQTAQTTVVVSSAPTVVTSMLVNYLPKGYSGFTYTITMSGKPAASLTLTLTFNSAMISVTPTSVTLTSANYSTPQTITVNALSSYSTALSIYTASITHTGASALACFALPSLQFTSCDQSYISSSGVLDLSIFPPGSVFPVVYFSRNLAVTPGSTSTYTVVLDTKPTSNVVVTPVPEGPLSVSPASLTFTSTNFATAQTVTVSASKVLTSTGGTFIPISHTLTGNSNYVTFGLRIPVKVQAYLVPFYTSAVQTSGDFVFREGKTGHFWVALTTQPTSDVTVSLSLASTAMALLGSSALTFQHNSFDVPQMVSLQTTSSAPAASSYSVVITLTVTSSDTTYNGLVPKPSGTLQATATNLCPRGYYSYPPGAGVCAPCPQGYSCTSVYAQPVACSALQYSPYREWRCLACPAGYSCSGSGMPSPCSPGTQAVAGAGVCSACVGSPCGITDGSDTAVCEPGTYLPSSLAMMCRTCPFGFGCAGGAAAPQQCSAGKYSSLGDITPCPNTCAAGFYCFDSGMSSSKTCPLGYFSLAGTTWCTPCPAGSSCIGSTVTACAAGSYSLKGWGRCKPCSYGSCSTLQDEIHCAVGQYVVAKVCTACPAGSVCDGIAAYPTIAGEYSLAGVETICSLGSYSAFGDSTCTQAPAGSFANAVINDQHVCLAGTYSSTPGRFVCPYCPPGSLCGVNTSVPASCVDGYYCHPSTPRQQLAGSRIPCIGGTTLSGTAHSTMNCALCTAGNQCSMADFLGNTPCSAGYFCPTGTFFPYPCMNGTFQIATGKSAQSDCTQCTAGKYCPDASTTVRPCLSGNYCPAGSHEPTPCPKGTFLDGSTATQSTDCGTCPIGSVCPPGSILPILCFPGSYNPTPSGISMHASCKLCTAASACSQLGLSAVELCGKGSVCKEGAHFSDEFPCFAGTENDVTNAATYAACTICPAGYYCIAGSSNTTQKKLKCPRGSLCSTPGQVSRQSQLCAAGTYSYALGATVGPCAPCPAGFYCAPGSFVASDQCKPGHYCGSGTARDDQFPCAAGTYSNVQDLTLSTQCTTCPAGYYCFEGTAVPRSCPPGTYSNSGANSASQCQGCTGGNKCPPASPSQTPCGLGYYSESNWSFCSVCPAGAYCSTATTNNAPTNFKCPAGKWCPKGTSLIPTLSTSADCPSGFYCPLATPKPSPCLPGKKRTTAGGANAGDCVSSTAGYYTVPGSDQNTGQCEPGFYCPAGSTGPFAVPCPANTFMQAPGGASSGDCLACLAGYYCALGAKTPSLCPSGSYCPANSQTPTPCPAGKLGQSMGLKALTDCSPCPVGYYCSQPGLIVPDGTCAAGVYCAPGSTSSSGSSVTPTVCSSGHYCVPGLSVERNCPSGTYNPSTGAKDVSACIPCTKAFYCLGATVTPTLSCPLGYYCPTGTSFGKAYPAPPGFAAPVSSASPVQCPQNTYNNEYAQGTCQPCLQGFYCTLPATSLPIACPAGRYCTSGVPLGQLCPVGTFNPMMGQTSSAACISCIGGKYCGVSGLALYEGDCDPGYWCLSASPLKNPATVNPAYGPCPVGHFCPIGTAEPAPCPSGTINAATLGVSQLASCSNCPPGQFCEQMGGSVPQGACRAGYFCHPGERTATAPDRSLADPRHCVAGQYCPTASSTPSNCSPGSYQINEYQAACKTCPQGFFCTSATGNYFTAGRCLQGYYCIVGTKTSTAYPCPAGQYNPRMGRTSPVDCLVCDPGSYCPSSGLGAPAGLCQAGYFCSISSTTDTPNTPDPGTTTGGKCMMGTYCPAGSSASRVCDGGHYCGANALGAVSGPCDAGYYCIAGASSSHPVDGLHGNPCPLGAYCPVASVSPVPCPVGTYLPSAGSGDLALCVICPSGFYCKGVNQVSLSGVCPAGYFCVSNTYEAFPQAGRCPAGSACPSGSSAASTCIPGYFQPLPLQATCNICPVGYYCDGTTPWQAVICPAGSYCTGGSITPTQCAPGTLNPLTGAESIGMCTPCPAGSWCTAGRSSANGLCQGGHYCKGGATAATPTRAAEGGICPLGSFCPAGATLPMSCPPGRYCGGVGLLTDSGPCQAGYYCLEGSSTATPMDGITGSSCPAGFYCPAGSSYPSPCPVGTYNSAPGMVASIDCATCPQGFYCAGLAATAITGRCSAGYFCPPGQHNGSYSGNICPVGTFCPAGSAVPTNCPPGFYNLLQGQASCSLCPKAFTCEGAANSPVLCQAGYACAVGVTLATLQVCGSGTFQPFSGQALCLSCPAGSYCPVGPLTLPLICPAGNFCPQGSDVPLNCLPGTYTAASGLQDSSQCRFCPVGKYCIGGISAGDCSAGYYCLSGSNTPTPDGFSNSGLGYPCPIGYYCPAATPLPIPCPNGQFIMVPGGKAVTDCTLCQAGYYCLLNDPIPKACPLGSYCPAGSSQPKACPAGTYNSQYLAESSVSCLPCPPGTLCSAEGIGLNSNYPCTPGYYCPSRALVTVPSPQGYFSPGSRAGSILDLLQCPGGFLCPERSIGYEICGNWTYCPPGSWRAMPCPLGYYCGNVTSTPVPCPADWYCPDEAAGLGFPPLQCPAGSICLNSLFLPIQCQAGERAVKVYSVSNQLPRCEACSRSTFSNTSRTVCDECEAGFVCLGNTTISRPLDPDIHHGYMVKQGYYAEIGSFEPQPCPAGTYNPYTGSTSAKYCIPCPDSTYNDLEGMAGCKVCGLWANSTYNRKTCQCTGENRMFLANDKSCPCKSHFEFIDRSGVSHTQSGLQDCQPVVFDRCPSGQLRSEMGTCVQAEDCSRQCNGGSGVRTPGLGICQCEVVVDVDSVCDAHCRQTTPRALLNGNGNMTITDPLNATAKVSIQLSQMQGLYGRTECYQNQSCKVRFVDSTQRQHIGRYSPPASLYSRSTKRLLNQPQLEGIPNPVICINFGETVLFSIFPPFHYPVFQPRSLLNTNPNLDYSAFQELQALIESGWNNLTTFAYTFNQPGLMLFTDSADSSQQMVLAVMSENTTCPDNERYVQPRTMASLKLLGAKLDTTIILAVNWNMVFSLCISLFVSILIYTLFFYFYNKYAWKLPVKEVVPYLEANKKFYIEPDPLIKSRLHMYLEDSDNSTESEELTRMLFSRPPNPVQVEDKTYLNENEDVEPEIVKGILGRIKAVNTSLLERFETMSEATKETVNEIRRQMEGLKRVLVEKADPFIRHKGLGMLDLEDFTELDDLPAGPSAPRALLSSYRLVTQVEMDEETEALNRLALRSLAGAPEVQETDKQKLMDEISGEFLRLQESLNYSKDRLQDYVEDRIRTRNAKRRAVLGQKERLETETREQRGLLEALGRKQAVLQAQEEARIDQEAHFQLLAQRAQLAGCTEDYQQTVAKAQEGHKDTADLLRGFELDLQKVEKGLSINQLREKAAVQKTIEEQRIKKQREATLTRKQREEAEVFFLQQSLSTAEKSLTELQQEETINNLLSLLEVPDLPVPTAEATATLQDISVDVESNYVPSKRRDAEHEVAQRKLEEDCKKVKKGLEKATGELAEGLRQELALLQGQFEANEERYDLLKKADLENALEERRQQRNLQQKDKRERQEREEKAWESRRQTYLAHQYAAVFRSALSTLKESLPINMHSTAIRAFLEEKHEVEFAKLREKQTRDQRFIHSSLIEDAYRRKITDLHLVRKEFRVRRLKGDKSDPSYEAKLQAVLRAEKEVTTRLDYICAQDLEEALERAWKDLRRKQAAETTALIDRHIEELRQVEGKELTKAETADLERVLAARKAHLEEDTQRKARLLDQHKAEMALRRTQQQQDLENMVRYEREAEAQQAASVLESRKLREMEEKVRRFEADLRARNISEENMETMLEDYVNTVAEADSVQAKERTKQSAVLAHKLAERRRRKLEIQDSLDRLKQEQTRWKQKVGTLPGLKHKGANKLLNRWRRYPKRPIKEVAARLVNSQPVCPPSDPLAGYGEVLSDSRLQEVQGRLVRVEALVKNLSKAQFGLLQENLRVFAAQLKKA